MCVRGNKGENTNKPMLWVVDRVYQKCSSLMFFTAGVYWLRLSLSLFFSCSQWFPKVELCQYCELERRRRCGCDLEKFATLYGCSRDKGQTNNALEIVELS